MIHIENTDGACCVALFPPYPKTSNPAPFFMTMNVDYECSSEPATETSNTFAMPDCEWVSKGVADVQEVLCSRLRKTGRKHHGTENYRST